MDERTVEAMDTDSVETDVIATNPVLTLITTEDGIPTSTEVTVLTTTLGEVPLMTASLETLAEVPLVTSHPTFVTSHPGVRTVYATSIDSSHAGQPVVVGEGQIALLETNGVQQTIVVHTNPNQLSTLTQVQSSQAQPHCITVNLHETTASPSEVEKEPVPFLNEDVSNAQEREADTVSQEKANALKNVKGSDQLVSTNNQVTNENVNPLSHLQTSDEKAKESLVSAEQDKNIQSKNCETPTVPCLSAEVDIVVPEEVVCLVCYQAFLNPTRDQKKDSNNDVDRSGGSESSEKAKDISAGNDSTFCRRTLGKFFEITRVNMSIVTRRSYKEYSVPICQNCNTKLVQAEQILDELRRLERELYYLRQTIKDGILSSYAFFNNKDNKDLTESRRNIPGLLEILDIVDRIRDDIINDGRPPKIPRSVVSSSSKPNRPGRKPKKQVNDGIITDSAKESTTMQAALKEVVTDEKIDNDCKDTDQPSSSTSIETESMGPKSEAENNKTKLELETDMKSDKPAIRTSFGRLIKRPTYMINEVTEDELSELGESSEDNYEEIVVKPELPPVEEESMINEEEIDEEDPAWAPEREMVISERVGIPPSSSDESDDFSGVDSDEDISKTKIKKEKTVKKPRKSKPSLKRKRAKRVPVVKQEELNYEVKVIQLDGTELMTINAARAGENIGLEPGITQKVMDSQAVIMVKNQLFGKRVQCHHCSRTFTDPRRRDVHVKKKHEGVTKPFECEVCQKRFSRQDHLKNHMKRHMRPPKEKSFKLKPTVSEKNHSCEFCEQRFRNKSELAVHTRTHTGERPYKCEYCNDAFVSALKREFHVEQMHPDVPPLRCEFCSKGFFRQHRLRIHAVSHTGEKANICELCGKSFSQAAMLRYHQTTHEELNLKQFKCQECNRVFANPQNLKSHMESQHQKNYRHRCPHCERGYTQMSHLRRHLRTHSGEQPFICSYCPKRFTSGAALKIHVRIHTGERPYWCSVCEKGFRSKTKLGRHMKTLIHSGENKDRVKKETVTTEIETVDMNAATTTTWTEIVGIITGV